MATPTMTELTGALDVLNKIIEEANEYNKCRMEEYGLTEDFCYFTSTMTDEEIDGLTLPQINSYLAQYGIDSSNILQIFAKGDNTISTLDKWKEFFAELRKATRDMDESLTTREELQQACDDVYSAQTEFLKSTEYKEAFKEKLSTIRRLAEQEPDPATQKVYLKKLDALKKSNDLTFLLARLDDPSINKKNSNAEIDRLVNIFFDKNRSIYLMDRYMTNASKLGLNPQYHVNLYDIEEKFLPEPFYPLNNFFLFVVMAYIAYIDPDDEIDHLYAITAISMMGNLLMGSLSEDETNTLLGMVRNIENRILVRDDVVERFRQNNSTWKEHPVRKELDVKKAEMAYRLDLISEIKGLMVGFGVNLVDGTTLTSKNASSILRKLTTEQIEGLRDDIKAEVERRKAETETEGVSGEDLEEESEDEMDASDGTTDRLPDESEDGGNELSEHNEDCDDNKPFCDTTGAVGELRGECGFADPNA